MKVSESIDALKMMPADAQVLVQGYESGFDDIARLEERPVIKNADAHDWDGEYDDAPGETYKKAFPAVVILGNRR